MALVVKDRVQETTVTVGTIPLVLGGAVSGFQSFSTIGNGNTTYYAVVGTTEWEVGIGTYTLIGTVLSRDTILASSNGGSAVNFSAGTKNVFVTYPAGKGLYTDASGNAIALGTPASATLTNATGLPISTGVSGLGTGVATFLATPTSANLASALTDETGTGANVFATSPTLVTPILGTPTSGTLTSCTGLPLTTGVTGTLPIANGGTGTTSTTFANLTTNVTGTLPVGNGGTGAATLTGVLKGNGTSAFTTATSGTDYSAGTSALTTGILKSTTTTGALSIAVAADFPTLNQNTTGSAATLTTTRGIYGNNFDGSAALTQIIASTYGGTGNGFTKFSGPATAEKTYTLPNSNATLLYDGGALGTPSSGTVTNLTGTASININGTVGATTANTGAFTTLSATGVTTVQAGTVSAPAITTSGDTNTGLWFPAADTIAASTGGTERWRIDSGGQLLSKTAFASGAFALSVGVSGAYPVDRGISVSNSSGSAIPFIAYTSSTTQAGYILTSGSTIAFVQGSDYRLKENVVDMDKSATLSKLMKARPVHFDWKDGNTLHNYGFIAHELQEVFPQAIHGEKDAVREDGHINPQSVNLTALVPYLVASVQEQQKLITTLQEQVLALQTKVGS